MKKVLLVGFTILLVVLAGCAGSNSASKPVKKSPPLLMTADFKLDRMDWFPGGGEKVTLPKETINVLVKEMIASKNISEKDEQAVLTVLEKFFPKGGMLNLWHNTDSSKNFGLAYYKNGNDLRLACIAKKKVIRFLLNEDMTFKEKLVVYMKQ